MSLLRTKVLLLIAMLLLSTSLTGCVGRLVGLGDGGLDMTDRPPENVDPEEYNVLYIGHSFGRKFAESLEEYAHLAGETNHTQYIEFSGGESGSTMLLWDDAEHQANIRAFLDTGEIDVLIMICCSPEFIRTLDTDQAVWNFTDHAVAKNPDVRIGLAMPWKDFPGEYGTQASMRPTRHSTSCRIGRTSLKSSVRIIRVRTCSPSIMAHSHTRCARCSKQGTSTVTLNDFRDRRRLRSSPIRRAMRGTCSSMLGP